MGRKLRPWPFFGRPPWSSLVPKLYLGTHFLEIPVSSARAARETEFREQAFPNRVWERGKTLVPLLIVLSAQPLYSQSGLPPVLRSVGFDQRLDAQVPLGLVFRDESGQAVRLQQYFVGKPVTLVLPYHLCPMLC